MRNWGRRVKIPGSEKLIKWHLEVGTSGKHMIFGVCYSKVILDWEDLNGKVDLGNSLYYKNDCLTYKEGNRFCFVFITTHKTLTLWKKSGGTFLPFLIIGNKFGGLGVVSLVCSEGPMGTLSHCWSCGWHQHLFNRF